MKKIRKITKNFPTLGENVNLRNKKHLGLILFLIFYNLLLLYILYTTKTSVISRAAEATETVTPLTNISAIIGFKYCSKEGGICSFPGTALVAFEAFTPGPPTISSSGTITRKLEFTAYQLGQFTNSVSCSSSVFGLFNPGDYKACFYKLLTLTPTPLPSTSCTDSDGGYNIYSTGKTNFSYASHPWVFDEVCLTSNTLAESSCNNNLMNVSTVTCPNGYYCKGDSWSGACVPGTPTPPPPTSDWCKDSDGLDIFNKGRVDFFSAGETPVPYYLTDSCQSGVVLEDFCDANKHMRTASIDCPNGYSCQNGACVLGVPTPTPPPPNSCTDSDGGYNIYVAGKVNSVYYGQNGFNSDACVSSSLLQENYCDTGISKYLAITCQKGCANGACISGASPTPTPTPVLVPTADNDRDGYSNAVEIYLGTNPNKACITDSVNEVDNTKTTRPSKTWPADLNTATAGLNSFNKINLLDLSSFTSPVRRLNTSTSSTNFDKRWDLNADGKINIIDMNIINALTPPMLNGVRAFNGPSCPLP